MKQISFDEAKKIMQAYSPVYPKTAFLKSEKDIPSRLAYPVIIKIDSPDIIHKSDAGMVAINIGSKEELLQKYRQMRALLKEKFPDARVNGFLVQEQVRGREVMVGMKRDETFGPVVVFGLGGIFVEVLKDVSFRIAPLSKSDALEMIKEIKAYRILEGIRGEKQANINAIADILLMISGIGMKNQNIMEIDLNPVMVNESTAYIVDARFLEGE